eukprot:TRINITY_DN50091_c0_g1_i1.p1 TRINITY_DN50091_c0_g1~~TRINITY_DN50091_c0_g1_i1.p1  ORF type:complete len:624 (+),score=136.66 TRINITY_DN50091_c0_g1_i1:67-1938(+)
MEAWVPSAGAGAVPSVLQVQQARLLSRSPHSLRGGLVAAGKHADDAASRVHRNAAAGRPSAAFPVAAGLALGVAAGVLTSRSGRRPRGLRAVDTRDTVDTALPAPTMGSASDFAAFSWRHQWYPMAFSKVTDKGLPHRLELFGEPLVLWWDGKAAAWRAMADRCPHRLAPLSEGRVDETGRIECPYHGWTFDGDTGNCAKIPQQDGPHTELAADSGLRSKCGGVAMLTVEKQGIIWMWGQPLGQGGPLPDEALIPTCEAMEDERFEWIDVSRDMPYSADMLLENVLDSSHVPFTHHQTISKRENAVPLALRLQGDGVRASGFEGKQEAPPDFKKTVTERTTKFVAPCYMHHRIRSAEAPKEAGNNQENGSPDFEAGFETWTVAYATPTGPGRCRLMARFPFRFPPPKNKWMPNLPRLALRKLPDWANHLGQLRVLDDDNIFLPIQERTVHDVPGGWKKNYVMPTAADTYVTAYRRWFDSVPAVPHDEHAVDAHRSLGLAAGAIVDKSFLLDRYAQHTAHCKSCQGALRRAKQTVKAANAALLTAAASVPGVLVALGSSSASLALQLKVLGGLAAFAGGASQVRKLAKKVAVGLTSGVPDYPPPRNRKTFKARELRTVEQGRRS